MTTFQPTLDSVQSHVIPDWYHDAKLGIFVHWGLYSVPAWAPLTGELGKVIAEGGWLKWFSNNPYAEWYQNSLAIGQGATYQHHINTYGADFKYEDFAPIFNAAAAQFDADKLANAFHRAGAQYAVLTTKHHEGFLLWPSAHPNPNKQNWQLNHDVVSALTDAVRARGLRMGLYYSGGLDWTFNTHVIKDISDLFVGVPQSPDYEAYATAHIYELIERYAPSVLWNDIGYPAVANLPKLFADYYNRVPEGVINDRFIQASTSALDPQEMMEKLAKGELGLPTAAHYDFKTPEYTRVPDITPHKWESCRGLGFSFGYNQNDSGANMLSVKELVHSFIDIVSKNGNLLLNVGPCADGSLPDNQYERLVGLGDWLAVNGEAIYGTRPHTHAEGKAIAGDQSIDTRFTRKGNVLYVTLLGTPTAREVVLENTPVKEGASVRLLGHDASLAHEQRGAHVGIMLPQRIAPAVAHVIKIEQ
jgi:alpha-L-fucosidase